MLTARSFKHRAPLRMATGALGLSALISISACGGGDGDASGDQVASLGTLAPADAATGSTTPADNEEAFLAYAQCLRDEGLDVDDPTFDADGDISGGFFGPDSGLEPGSEEFQNAQDACGSLIEGVTLGGPGGEGFDTEAIQEASLGFTECLRDEGLVVDDLDFSLQGPGGGQGGPPGDGSLPTGSFPEGAQPGPGGGQGAGDPSNRLAEAMGLDPDDPAVAAAVDVCGDVLTGALPQGGGAPTTTSGS